MLVEGKNYRLNCLKNSFITYAIGINLSLKSKHGDDVKHIFLM